MNLALPLQDQVAGCDRPQSIEFNDKFVRRSNLEAELGELDPSAQVDLVEDLGQARVGDVAALLLAKTNQVLEPLARDSPLEQPDPQFVEPRQNLLAAPARLLLR